MQVVAKKGGGCVWEKNFLSLSQTPPPYLPLLALHVSTLQISCKLEVFLKQVVFKTKGREGLSALPALAFDH